MKSFTIAIGLSVFLLAGAYAADIGMAWKGDASATEYRIYRSTDYGKTWKLWGKPVPQPKPFPSDKQLTTRLLGVPEDKLVLFRVGAVRDKQEGMLRHTGVWYDHRLLVPMGAEVGTP